METGRGVHTCNISVTHYVVCICRPVHWTRTDRWSFFWHQAQLMSSYFYTWFISDFPHPVHSGSVNGRRKKRAPPAIAEVQCDGSKQLVWVVSGSLRFIATAVLVLFHHVNCCIVNRLEPNLCGRENKGQLYTIHSLVQWLVLTFKFTTR